MDDATKIDDIAAAWAAREDKGPLASSELQSRDEWLAADVRHRGAYVRAHAVFLRAGRASALGRGFGQEERQHWGRKISGHRATWMSMAAMVLLAILGFGLPRILTDVNSVNYRTELGEVLRVQLPDASIMTLNSGTDVSVRYSDAERRIVLSKGEALVDVAKNPERPFVVQTGKNEVVAVGTSFSVKRRDNESFEVLVNEGVVAIKQPSLGLPPLRVRANHSAVAAHGRQLSVKALPEQSVLRRLAWRQGLIVFEGDSLADAALEFSRYSSVRILIEDPIVAERRVVGVYSSGDPEGFARAVADSLGLEAEKTPEGVYLRELN